MRHLYFDAIFPNIQNIFTFSILQGICYIVLVSLAYVTRAGMQEINAINLRKIKNR